VVARRDVPPASVASTGPAALAVRQGRVAVPATGEGLVAELQPVLTETSAATMEPPRLAQLAAP